MSPAAEAGKDAVKAGAEAVKNAAEVTKAAVEKKRISRRKRHRKVPFPCSDKKTKMDIFLQQIVNGLVQGSIYALVALGYDGLWDHGADQFRPRRGGDDRHAGHHHRRWLADQGRHAGRLAGLAGRSASVLVCMALGWGWSASPTVRCAMRRA